MMIPEAFSRFAMRREGSGAALGAAAAPGTEAEAGLSPRDVVVVEEEDVSTTPHTPLTRYTARSRRRHRP